MTKSTLKLALAVVAGSLFASTAYAGPVSLSDAQMDTVVAGSFVCPVIPTDGVLNADDGAGVGTGTLTEGVYYTVAPNNANELTVPMDATNGDGSGSPGGTFSAPGDTNYTAIWYQ